MNIDERIELLAERHEALTQTVEHLARQGEEQRQATAEQSRNIDRVAILMEKVITTINTLAESVISHERRP